VSRAQREEEVVPKVPNLKVGGVAPCSMDYRHSNLPDMDRPTPPMATDGCP